MHLGVDTSKDEHEPNATRVRRTLPALPRPHHAPLSPTDLRAMLEALPDGLLGARDRALLLVGFAAALRRAELGALDATIFVKERVGPF